MKLSLDWIKDFVSVPKKSPKELGELVTLHTAEVEEVIDQKKAFEGVVIGEMLEFKKHPNADKLNVAKVDIGRKEPLNLIFGQMVDMKIGDRIPVAVAPTTLPTGVVIEKREMRGFTSEGMLCLDQELGLKKDGVSLQYFPGVKPGTPLSEALGLQDIIFDIDNKALTHRPDLWGHHGFAREFGAIFGQKLTPYDEVTHIAGQKLPVPKWKGAGETIDVKIESKDISPRFVTLIVGNVKIAPAPDWMQARLAACGVRSINNVVDITNYVMMELGQPMHAFDRSLLPKGKMEVRYARKGETLVTLDEVNRLLTQEDAVISNGEKLVGLAGIMGGMESGISDDTTEVVFEAANWNPVMIRKTATRLGLRSDASARFEKSLDPEKCDLAVKRACALLLLLCPEAKLLGPLADKDLRTATDKELPRITISLEEIYSKIGVEVPEKDIIKILTALEFKVAKKKNMLHIVVPSFRATKDVDIAEDIVEEVARMYGYDKIPELLPHLPTVPPEENRERRLKNKVRSILSYGLGMHETILYSFYSENDLKAALLTPEDHVLVDNVLSQDQTHLRTTLLPNLLKWVEPNIVRQDRVELYEIGHTYIQSGEYFPKEEKWICGIYADKKPISKDALLLKAKGAAETFLAQFGAPNWKLAKAATPPPYAHPSHCLQITAGEKNHVIGWIYDVHPQVVRNFDTKAETAAIEINFTQLVKLGQRHSSYKPLPRFPGIDLDISVIVDRKARVADIRDVILKCDPSLIESAELFDVFEGEKLGKDKKSLAYRVRLQALDRTLTEEEMHGAQRKIVTALEKIGGAVRTGSKLNP